MTIEDRIQPAAGIIFCKKIGHRIKKGEAIAVFHHDGNKDLNMAQNMVLAACKISLQKPRAPRLIRKVLTFKKEKR